jgi:hypothetical protein
VREGAAGIGALTCCGTVLQLFGAATKSSLRGPLRRAEIAHASSRNGLWFPNSGHPEPPICTVSKTVHCHAIFVVWHSIYYLRFANY